MIRGFKNRQLNTKIVNKMFDEIMRCLLCASHPTWYPAVVN